MKINTLWIVTNPTPDSTLEDICFETDAQRLALQFRGGLEADKIHGMYSTEKEAREIAQWLIHIQTEQV